MDNKDPFAIAMDALVYGEHIKFLVIIDRIRAGIATPEEIETFKSYPVAEFLCNSDNYCIKCNALCPKYRAFCTQCGMRNYRFNQALFYDQAHIEYRECKRMECSMGHLVGRMRLPEHPTDFFCELCGQDFRLLEAGE